MSEIPGFEEEIPWFQGLAGLRLNLKEIWSICIDCYVYRPYCIHGIQWEGESSLHVYKYTCNILQQIRNYNDWDSCSSCTWHIFRCEILKTKTTSTITNWSGLPRAFIHFSTISTLTLCTIIIIGGFLFFLMMYILI